MHCKTVLTVQHLGGGILILSLSDQQNLVVLQCRLNNVKMVLEQRKFLTEVLFRPKESGCNNKEVIFISWLSQDCKVFNSLFKSTFLFLKLLKCMLKGMKMAQFN